MLFSRDAAGDRERAMTLLGESHATATEIGMVAVAADALALLKSA
jgi:hypothetical protein